MRLARHVVIVAVVAVIAVLGAKSSLAATHEKRQLGQKSLPSRPRFRFPARRETRSWFSWTMHIPGQWLGAFPVEYVDVVADPAANATLAIQAGIDECFSRTVVQGRGRCELLLAYGATYWVTTLKIPAGMRDFTLDGRGATLMFFRENMVPPRRPRGFLGDILYPPLIDIESCARCEFRDFRIDWDWQRFRIASVANFISRSFDFANNEESWSFDIISPRLPNGRIDDANFHDWHSLHPFDWQTMAIGVQGQSEFYFEENTSRGIFAKRDGSSTNESSTYDGFDGDFPQGAQVVKGGTKIEVNRTTSTDGGLTPNIERPTFITITFKREGNNFGTAPNSACLWMIKHLTYEIHGVRMQKCTSCFLTNVHILSAPGKAVWIDRGSERIVIDGLRIEPPSRPSLYGNNYVMSGAADGVCECCSFAGSSRRTTLTLFILCSQGRA
jgi:hypothetical protein